MSIDILNLEWPSSDRDLHIVTPALVYLNKKYDVTFKTCSIFNGYFYILKYKPRVLVISNFSGADINHEITKFAYRMGIKVVSFISEGNVKEEVPEQFLWGWNTDKVLYVDKMLLWSKRSEKLFLKIASKYQNKFATVGGTGFDRYKILNFLPKDRFLQENDLKYNKIIGIAGWGFDHYFGEYFEKRQEYFLKTFGEEEIQLHRQSLEKLQNIYANIIKNNPDILFILRYHPGTVDFEKNEFYGLDRFKNIFISNKFQNNHYQISDLINVSDLWIGYETTTAMEAWLLGKQTFLINPIKSDFIRENVHKGSPIVKTYEQAQKLIDEYFSTKTMKAFERLHTFRDRIIRDVIEYDDGKNHIRAAEEIIKVFNAPDKKIKFSFRIYKEAFKQILKLVLSKTIIRNRWSNLNYKSDFAKPYQDMYDKVVNV